MKPPKGRRRSTGQLPQPSAGLFLAASTAAAPFHHPEESSSENPSDTFPPLEGIKDQIRHMFQSVHSPTVVSSPKARRTGSGRRSSVAGPVLAKELPPGLRNTDSITSLLNSSFDDQSLENIRVPNPAFYIRDNHVLERPVSYEEELERKTWTLREIAVSWKHRWMRERQERRTLSQRVVECEQECMRVIESVRDQHDLKIKVMEEDFVKLNRICEDVSREKSTLEASFRQMLEQIESQKSEHEAKRQETNKTVANVKKENERLLKALAKVENENKRLRAENEKLQKALSEKVQLPPPDSPSGVTDDDKFTDYYKLLLDIAINKVKQIEEKHAYGGPGSSHLGHVARRNTTESIIKHAADGVGLWRTGAGSDVKSWDSMSSLDSYRSDVTDRVSHSRKLADVNDRALTTKLSLQSWPELPEVSSVSTGNHARHISEPLSMSTDALHQAGSRVHSHDSESAESGYHTLVYPSGEGAEGLSHSYSEDNLIAVAAELDESVDDQTKFNTISSNRKREKRSTSITMLREKTNKPDRRSNSCAGNLETDILSLSENNLLDIGKDKSSSGKRVSKSRLLDKWQGLDLKVRAWRQKRRNLSDLGSVFKGKSRDKDGAESAVGDGENSNPGSIDLSDSECKSDERDKRGEESSARNSKSGFKGLTSRRNGVAMQMADQLVLSENLKPRKGKGNILELLKTWKTPGTSHNGNNNNNIHKTSKEQRKKFGKV